MKSSGGSISLTGVRGKHEVKSSGGHLGFLKVDGELTAATSGGSVSVENFTGSLNARSSGGRIKLHEAQGTVFVFTSGGSILLDRVSGSVDATTTGGHIQVTMLALEDKLLLKSSGGNINVIIPKNIGLNLDLKADRVKTELIQFDGEAKESRVVGRINGGGIEVMMAASAGKICLQYQ